MRYITLLTATSTPEGPPPGELMAAIAQLGAFLPCLGPFGLLDPAHVGPLAGVGQSVEERARVRIATERGAQIVRHRHRPRR